MALTLPYPNLDFVPLDVLTAEQMNQMVANTNYIANQFPISSSNINWNSYYYKPGDVIQWRSSFTLAPGRQQARAGEAKNVTCTFILEKPIATNATGVSFTQLGYVEAFDDSRGAIFSTNNTSKFSITASISSYARNTIQMKITLLDDSYTLNHNHSCVVAVDGKFTIS